MRRILVFLFISLSFSSIVRSQDTLPRFTVAAKGPGKILVSWHNRYHNVSQISIQRSTDSLKYFTTLLTVPDPTLPENGAMDNKASHPNFYYRLFIVLDEGKYLFTSSHRPQSNTGVTPAAQKEDIDESDAILTRSDQRLLFAEPPGDRRVIRPNASAGYSAVARRSPLARIHCIKGRNRAALARQHQPGRKAGIASAHDQHVEFLGQWLLRQRF